MRSKADGRIYVGSGPTSNSCLKTLLCRTFDATIHALENLNTYALC